MSTINFSVASKTARATALNTSIGTSAKIILYSGTIPTNPDTAIGAQIPLATFTGNATAFAVSSSGVLTLNGLTDSSNQVNASNTGTVAFARITTSGATAVIDLDVATSGAYLTVNTASIVSGGPIQLAVSGTITEA